MLQVIKWEFVKQYHRLKWMFLLFAAVLLSLALLPASWFETENDATSMILMFFYLTLAFGALGLSLYPMYNMISDFRRKTYTMERITGRSHIPVFFAKIIINLAVFLLVAGLVYANTKVLGRFSPETMHYFTFTPNEPYMAIVLEMVLLYPAILLFCYMSASTNHYFRNHRTIGTLIGVAVVSMIGSFLHLSGPVYYVVGLITGIILIIASGRMADQRFEQHVYNY